MTMASKIYPYSMDRKDKKIAGVCSTIGAMTGVDPTFIRMGFVAAAILISFKVTLILYGVIAIYVGTEKRRAARRNNRMSDFDRMELSAMRRPTVHAMVNDLDETDRRLMAIDHHINSQNEELAREIEALRQEEK
jgi:phage shock protein PspC (stress-responsive transcriptional regulator)